MFLLHRDSQKKKKTLTANMIYMDVIGRRSCNNIRYSDDAILVVDSKCELY